MARDQGRERILGVAIAPREEPLEQLGVGPATHRPEGVECMDVPEDAASRFVIHSMTVLGAMSGSSIQDSVRDRSARSRIGRNRAIVRLPVLTPAKQQPATGAGPNGV